MKHSDKYKTTNTSSRAIIAIIAALALLGVVVDNGSSSYPTKGSRSRM